MRAEFEVFRALMLREREERDLHPLPAVPAVVIVAGKFLPLPLPLELDQEAYFGAELRRRIEQVAGTSPPDTAPHDID